MKYSIKYVLVGLILCFGFLAQANGQKDWKYTQFPLVKPNKKIALPSKLVLNRETLKPILHPRSGTHKLIGVDQIYISKNPKRRIFVKQNVVVSNPKILNQWVDIKNGSVYHFKKDLQTVAIFAQGYNERSLNEIEKSFTKTKFNKSNANLMSLFVQCAYAQSEIGFSDPMGVNPAAIEETYQVGSAGDPAADEDLVGCIFAKTGQGLWDAGVSTKDAVVNGASALWNDPMGAARSTGTYLYDTGASVVSGAKAAGGAIVSGAVSSYNYVTENYDDPSKVWGDVTSAYDRTLLTAQTIYKEFETSVAGFMDLPKGTRNLIICEATAMAVTSLGISGVMALTGVGSAAAVAKAANFLRNVKNLTTRMLPVIREFGTSGLSSAQKKQIIQGLLNGKMTDDQAWAMMKAPDSKAGAGLRSAADIDADAPAASALGQDAKLAANSKLNPEERVAKAENVLTDLNGGKPVSLSPDQQAAILKSHEVGLEEGRGYGTWTQADINQKARILKEAGFTEEQRRALMDEGVTGAYGYIKRDPSIPFSSREGVSNIDDVLAGTNQMTTLEAKTMGALRTKTPSVTTLTDLTEASEISLEIAKYQSAQGQSGKATAYLARSLAYQTKPLQSTSERVYKTQLDLVQKTNYFGDLDRSNFNDKYPTRGDLFVTNNFTDPVKYLSVRRMYNELSLLNFMSNNPGAYPGIKIDNSSVKAARENYTRLLRAYEASLGLPPTGSK